MTQEETMFFTSETVDYHFGTIPVILTSQHDGYLSILDGSELPVVKGMENIGNDTGSRELTVDLSNSFDGYKRPYVLIYKVVKNRSDMEKYYIPYLQVLRMMTEMCICAWGKCLVLDIHRFYKHPAYATKFDIWLGTNHRKTIRSSMLDFELVRELRYGFQRANGRSLDVYVPSEEPRDGERFMATGKNPDRIIQTPWLAHNTRATCIQVEVYSELLLAGKQTSDLVSAFKHAILHIG